MFFDETSTIAYEQALISGTLSNQGGDGNKEEEKQLRSNEQNNNSARSLLGKTLCISSHIRIKK